MMGPGRRLRRAAFYLTLVLVSLPMLFIFYWMVITSLKPRTIVTAYPPAFLFPPVSKTIGGC